VRVRGRVIYRLRTRLAGAHQYENAACAVAALDALRRNGLVIRDSHVREGLARVRWPGRLEHVAGRPAFLFDAAHNADGCAALARHLQREARPRSARARRVLIFGAMADKQYPEMLRLLRPLVDRVFYCPPDVRRAASSAQLQRVTAGTPTRGTADALARARRAAGPGGEVIVAGSIFLVADARARVLGLRSDPLIRM
jgi:dihydrofolate synthase/folylpolyglutamate synthase